MGDVVIIADSQGKGYDFARQVYEHIRNKAKRKFSVRLTDLDITNFRDREFKVKIKDNIRRRKCFFIHDSNKEPCRWFTELAFTLDAMAGSSPEEVNVVLPYMRFARQDRKDESRVSVNSKVVATLISHYAKRGMTVDLHSPQVQQYFNIPFDNLYSFPSLVEHLRNNHEKMLEKLVVVSPDVGGSKRAESLLNRLGRAGYDNSFAVGYKVRGKVNEVEQVQVMGDVRGKNCLMVDDIVDTGGTMIKTCEALREKRAKSVYAYGTHGLFTDRTEKFSCFDGMMTSDTLYHAPDAGIEVVSLVELFGEAIYKTVLGESMSALFDGVLGSKQ